MNKTLERLLTKYNELAKAHGIEVKSVEYLRFMQQVAIAVERK